MGEDRRIIKTRHNLRQTLVRMLGTQPFEKISVSELCREASTSRITFYTYYPDKYALLDDLLHEYYEEAYDIYHQLQQKNNPELDDLTGYMNLLDCILMLMEEHKDFFSVLSPNDNPYLISAFYKQTFDSVRDYIVRHQRQLRPRYAPESIAALLCGSSSSLMYERLGATENTEEARREIHAMYRDLLESNLFERAGRRKG